MGICYVIGAGECRKLDFKKEKEDLIIAADGGYKHLLSANIKPDIIIGDFDSLKEIPNFDNIIKLNPIKDITDTDAAVKLGIEKGYKNFIIYGGLGGRLDHSIANIQLVAALSQKKITAVIKGDDTEITAVTDGKINFASSHKGYISIFSHSDKCEGVYLKGFKYPLDNAMLTNIFPLGVSNEFTDVESEIIITKGTAIIILNT